MHIGSHVSSSGNLAQSVDRAVSIGCESMQVFTSNPKGWNFKVRSEEEIDLFLDKLKKSGIKQVFGHTIYLTNLASQNPYIYTNSINALVSGLLLAEKAGFTGVVTHIGSYGEGSIEKGIDQVANALKQTLNITKGKVPIFLETDAGSGHHLGGKFSEIAEILKKVNSKSVGICLDTCHIYAAGYDISTKKGFDKVLLDFDRTIGLNRLKVLHLNDSKGELGSHLDRHEEIGKGKIGLSMFKYIVNHPKLSHLPGVVETPDNKDTIHAEKLSIDTLKELRTGK
jgi:deoxyribonuclease-4